MTSQRQIHEARDEVERLEKSYLKSRGWQYTSATPGCYLLWEKDFERDGVTQRLVVNQAHALAIEGVVPM